MIKQRTNEKMTTFFFCRETLPAYVCYRKENTWIHVYTFVMKEGRLEVRSGLTQLTKNPRLDKAERILGDKFECILKKI